MATSGYAEQPRLPPLSSILCQNRNRVFSPQLGRFLQPDPNETGMTLIGASYNGRGIAALAIAFDMGGHYAPSLNHYEYANSNPWRWSDPLGLEPWDPFDMADDFQAEHAAEGAAALDNVHAGAAAAKSLLANLLTMISVVGVVGEFWRYAMGEQSLTSAIVWSVVDLIPAAGPLAKGFKWAFKSVGLWWKVGKNARYVGRTIRWGGRIVVLTAEAAEHIGKILLYDQAVKLTAGFCHAIEAHHLIPNRFMRLVPG